MIKIIIVKPKVELLQISNNPKELIELAGRTCYKSENKITKNSASKFVKMLFEKRHHSVIEHAFATFKIITDRGVTHELVRHRLASYSQESTRYVRYNQLQVINPGFKENSEEFTLWIDTCKKIANSYKKLLNLGYSPQIARSVLPNCLKTEIVVTANFREWMHIIELRTSNAAHPQIRQVIKAVSTVLYKYVPEIFPSFENDSEILNVEF